MPESIPGSSTARRNSFLFGTFTRKERWSLSLRAKGLVLLLLLGGAFLLARAIHPFLAVDAPVNGNILIIEGWAPPWAMIETSERYRNHHYEHLLIVRTALDANSEYDLGWSSADYAAAALAKNGVPAERIAKVFTVAVHKDRTFHSALGARNWLSTNNVQITGIDVATIGAHARRSGLLYRKAFGPDVPLGTISLDSREYDKRRWWRYSEGVRTVIGECIAYFYALFLFSAD